jgi:hypothetical protein
MLKGMSRHERRARMFEYSQLMASAIVVAVIGFFLLGLNTRMVNLYEENALYLPYLTTTYMAVHWLGILLLPLLIVAVLLLKIYQAPRGVLSAVSLGIALLSAVWLGIGIWAYTVPLGRMG